MEVRDTLPLPADWVMKRNPDNTTRPYPSILFAESPKPERLAPCRLLFFAQDVGRISDVRSTFGIAFAEMPSTKESRYEHLPRNPHGRRRLSFGLRDRR